MIEPRTVLLLGASGMGMAPLALYLNGAGIRVEAFDDHFVEPVLVQFSSFKVFGLYPLYPAILLFVPEIHDLGHFSALL